MSNEIKKEDGINGQKFEDKRTFGKEGSGSSRHSNGRGKPGGKPGSGSGSGGRPGGEDRKFKTKGKQDPFWYAKDITAIKNMASLPWNNVVGANFPGISNGSESDRVATALIIPFLPIPGSSASLVNDELTRAANTYYQYVTQGFTGGVDFEAPDLLMSALAGVNVCLALEDLRRVMGLLSYCLNLNNHYPQSVVESLGFDYDSLVENRANIRTQFNIWVQQVNKIVAVPKNFFYWNRLKFIIENLFTDSTEPTYHTSYAYVPHSLLSYESTLQTTGTSLASFAWHDKPGVRMTWDDFSRKFNLLFNRIVLSDDVRAMYGALRRVYSDAEFIKLEELSLEYTTTVQYHTVVNAQLHNMKWVDTLFATDATEAENIIASSYGDEVSLQPVLVQKPGGYIRCRLLATINDGESSLYELPEQSTLGIADVPAIIDLEGLTNEPGNILDVTGTMVARDGDTKSIEFKWNPEVPDQVIQVNATPISTRCEVYLRPVLFDMNPFNRVNSWYSYPTLGSDYRTLDEKLPVIAKISHIAAAPFMPRFRLWNSKDCYPEYILGSVDMYTTVSQRVLSDIHHASQYVLMMMPENSKSITKR